MGFSSCGMVMSRALLYTMTGLSARFQILVIGACQLAALSCGGALGYPMVLLHQLRRPDSPIKLDIDSASWIGAMHGLAGITSIIVPSFMQWRGRKAAFLFGCIAVTLGWIIAYCANSIPIILTSEFVHSLGTNSLHVVSALSLTEMTSPKFRNSSIQVFSIIKAFGMTTAGILSAFLTSKMFCVIMIIPIAIALILSIFWPESPSWLACKGRFDETYSAYKLLRDIDESSKKELEDLITAQKKNLSTMKKDEYALKFYWEKVKRRDFYVPAIHMFVLLNLAYWSGSAVFIVNSFDVIQKTTQSDKAAFLGGVIINAVLFVGLLLSSMLNKKFENKAILLLSVLSTSVCLVCTFIVTLLQSMNIVAKDSLVCMYLIIAAVMFISLGIIPIVYTLVSEIMPVKHRGIGGALFVIFNSTSFATALKLSPYLFIYIEVWGTFLVYTFNTIICGIIIWKYVPETKNRTLQEIEDFYMFGKFIQRQPCDDESQLCNVE